jgi:hypothetical protein
LLVRTDLGYQTANVVRARLGLPARTYSDSVSFSAFYDRLSTRLQDDAVQFALTNFIMLYETPRQSVEVEPGGGQVQRSGVLAVSEGYLPMFGIRLIEAGTSRARTVPDQSQSQS